MVRGIFLENDWGEWGATWKGKNLTALFLPGSVPEDFEKVQVQDHPVLKKLRSQLQDYLQCRRVDFHIPFVFQGTDFQIAVWQELLKIPYGETRTYGEIANALGGKNKARAVGGACNKNPLAIIIPCHRVVGQGGKLVGFGGGVSMKKKLLELEGREKY